MGVWVLSWAALFFSLLAFGRDSRPVHFVFDLDDTLIRWVRPQEGVQGTILPAAGDINGYRYRVLDGAPELLASLLKDFPNAKISFFSAAHRDRNLKVLSEMRLPDGRSALEVASGLYSTDDLERAPEKANSPVFSGKEKKNLKRFINGGVELGNVILIDDKPGNAYSGQEKNLLWVGAKPELHVTELKTDGSEQSRDVREFLKDRNKLARIRGLIEQASESSQARGVPIREALWELQWSEDGSGRLVYRQDTFNEVGFYRKGAQLLRQANSDYRFTQSFPHVESIDCLRFLLKRPAQ